MNQFTEIPSIHREFLLSSVEKLKSDKRILGVAGGGSLTLKSMDEFSDLDLVVVVDPTKYQEVLSERKKIAQMEKELSSLRNLPITEEKKIEQINKES